MNASGTILNTFSPSSFSDPIPVALDSSGNIYVGDQGNNDILKLDRSGNVLDSFFGETPPYIEGTDYPGVLDDVTIKNAVTLTADQSVDDLTIAGGGTLDLNGHTLTVSGNFINNGTFTASSGTIDLTGTNQVISGTNTFYNLTKTTTAPDTLFFTNGTQTVTGNLSLNGVSGNLLTVRTTSNPPPQFKLKWGDSSVFNFPEGIVTDSHRNVYVADFDLDTIQKFDSSGNLITSWGSNGSGDGQFESPYGGLVVDASDNIYLPDYSNNRIDEFTSSGTFIKTWGWGVQDGASKLEVCTSGCEAGISGSGDGQFDFPWGGLAIDPSGNVYVYDPYNARIEEFDSSANFLKTWGWGVQDGSSKLEVCTSGCEAGISGSGDGQLGEGYGGLAIDASGNVYLLDHNARIEEFTSNGIFVKTWGWGVQDGSSELQVCTSGCEAGISGSGDGELHDGYNGGLAIDASGIVYVGDPNNSRVEMFTTAGAFLGQFGSSGSGEGQFGASGFYYLTVDNLSNVYVPDSGDDRIEKFSPVSDWTIDPQGGISVSYLAVSGSDNIAESSIECTTGCVDQGGNTAWAFPSTVFVSSGASYAPPGWTPGYAPPVASSPSSSATSSLPIVASSTVSSSSAVVSSTSSLEALLQSLEAQLATLETQAKTQGISTPTSSASSSLPLFTRNLMVYDSGGDVWNLQTFLIAENKGAAAQALHRHGPSGRFGPLTYGALKEFQASVGLPVTGYFGPLTRAWVNGH